MKKLFLIFVLFIATVNAQYNLNFYDYLGYLNTTVAKEFGMPEDIKNLEDDNVYCYFYNKNIDNNLIKNSIMIFCFDERNNKVKLVSLSYSLKKDKGNDLNKFGELIGKKLADKKFILINKNFNEDENYYSLILYNSAKNIKIEIRIKDINSKYLSIILFAHKID